ncbi:MULTISPECIES: ATP-binding protein [Deefgea]|uniref:Chromosome segregation protein SMC n=1 Tax=Deefgea chitinilytica TaxID=570276 RepID=A0ABS2CF67_9NEIS|nr:MULTISPECIES: AAA family ATPase [Deefgea]MBM5572777.1 chromosome segregation protein SMC [Deefgea chitinilytica]MBM9890014.1 AAA family ATPase [Deefgea sp. CFH1-16]
MFQIKTLEMVHWDFWQRISVPLDAQIVTVVGPNGSGKTTLLDALRTMLALKCSGRRDYKRYVRNNKENIAWLRAVVSNPKRTGGGFFPYLFFPLASETVTLFCRIKKQGGDWVRQYAIAEGDAPLDGTTENNLQWLGVGDYRRRLEQAGLTPAIAEVLALEQGDTDKLCEYSPKTLLDLVFQVFGDKEVLDHYSEAKLRLREAEGELDKMNQQLSQLGLDVERFRLRASSYLEWCSLTTDTARLEQEVIPALQVAEAQENLRTYLTQFKQNRRSLWHRRGDLAQLEKQLAVARTAAQQTLQGESQSKADYDLQFQAFQAVRDAARDTEKLIKEGERLRELAEREHGADAVGLNDRLAELKQQEGDLKLWLKNAKEERQQLSEAQFALQAGKAPSPEFVRQMRSALDAAGIPHQLLTEICEVKDSTWQDAVEALLAPSKHLILLQREADKQRAWEVGERLRYRSFIVSEREPAPRATLGSILEILDFKAPVPAWLTRQLNGIQRVKSVEAGARINGDWITREGYLRERRGARFIGVDTRDYAFGEAARHTRLSDIASRLKALNEEILNKEADLSSLMRDIAAITQQLMGMQAVVQLASRQAELASAAARYPEEQAAVQRLGAELAAAQAALESSREGRADLRLGAQKIEIERDQLQRAIDEMQAQLQRQRNEISRQLGMIRVLKEKALPAWLVPATLRQLKEDYNSVSEVRHMIARQTEQLSQAHWEKDETIVQRRDKLLNDYKALEGESVGHRQEVERTAQLTDEARAAYINKLRATVRAYGRNVKGLGELAGIDVELDMPHLENDDVVLAQAGLTARFNFDQKGMMGLNDGEASGGQQVMKSLILLIGLMMDESNPSGFVFIDEPFAHLDIFNIDRVGAFLKATNAQYLITTPLTHNTNVYGPAELTLTTRKKRPGETWAPLIMQTRRRIEQNVFDASKV